MKRLFVIFAAVASVIFAFSAKAVLPQPDLIADIHFIGGQKVSTDKVWPYFTNEFASREAVSLRRQTADKLAGWLARWLQTNPAAWTPDDPAKLRPLLDDLQNREWFLDIRTSANDTPMFALAIETSALQVHSWQSGLKAFFPDGSFKESNGWLYFESGPDATVAASAVKRQMAQPSTNWLTVDINWPHLAKWQPQLKELGMPETRFEVNAVSSNLQIQGTCFFPENLSLKLDPWQEPDRCIQQPFMSFTAIRGIAGWLKAQPWAQPFQLNPPINELIGWSLTNAPFQSYLAAPVNNSAMAFRQIEQQWPPFIDQLNKKNMLFSKVSVNANDHQLGLAGLQLLYPYAETISIYSGNYLLFCGATNVIAPFPQPLPPRLYSRLAYTNLVFYHWEWTSFWISDQLRMYQTLLLLTKHQQINDQSFAFLWVMNTCTHLGPTVTQIFQNAPDQFTFTRTAPGGLTALEFLVLAQWLEMPEFPKFDLRPLETSVKPKPSNSNH